MAGLYALLEEGAGVMNTGYIYRIADADKDRLGKVIAQIVGDAGWTFGGAALWEFDSQKGCDNLRPIKHFTKPHDVDVRGDFGHAFSKQGEVRWKRRDTDHYDVLILSEQEQGIEGAVRLGDSWETKEKTSLNILQTGDYPSVGYITYHSQNSAVQFIRYTEVQS